MNTQSRQLRCIRMGLVYAATLCTLMILPCAAQTATPDVAVVLEDPRLTALFVSTGVEGCMAVFDPQQGTLVVHNPERVGERYLPASTFKILNSLIALETGAVSDTETVVKWDGVDRGWGMWNRDHTMRSAIACSAVWVYQEFARRIGEARMQHWVRAAGYGNADIGGNLDSFWLDGALRISALEQLGFLQRLHDNALPFAPATMEQVRGILAVEQSPATTNGIQRTLYAKSGWAQRVAPQVGWQVGWVQSGGNVVYFALNITIHDRKDAQAREVLMHKGLSLLGVW